MGFFFEFYAAYKIDDIFHHTGNGYYDQRYLFLYPAGN
jgi:hypothetical protein